MFSQISQVALSTNTNGLLVGISPNCVMLRWNKTRKLEK